MERYRVLSSIGVQCCKRSYPQQNNIHCIFEFGAVLGCYNQVAVTVRLESPNHVRAHYGLTAIRSDGRLPSG